jgi:hypothetical protein
MREGLKGLFQAPSGAFGACRTPPSSFARRETMESPFKAAATSMNKLNTLQGRRLLSRLLVDARFAAVAVIRSHFLGDRCRP